MATPWSSPTGRRFTPDLVHRDAEDLALRRAVLDRADVSKATPADTGVRGAARVRAAFGLWADAPSEPTWDHFVGVLQEVVGEGDAAWMLADLEPYLGRNLESDRGAPPA